MKFVALALAAIGLAAVASASTISGGGAKGTRVNPSVYSVPPPDWRSYPRALWRFEPSPGLLKHEGTAGHATLLNPNGAVADTTNYREGAQAVVFDKASNQYLYCSDTLCGGTGNLDFDGATTASWGCKLRVTSNPSPDVAHVIMGKGDEYNLSRATGSSGIATCNDAWGGTATGALAQDTWYLVVCSNDGANLNLWRHNSGTSTSSSWLSNTSSNFTINSSTAATDWGGQVDECFVDDIAYSAATSCRICSCGFSGELCRCDGTTPTSYFACTTNADCRPTNGIEICDGGLCRGRRSSCGSCTLPSCNQSEPKSEYQAPVDWSPYPRALWRFEDSPGFLVGTGTSADKTLTNNGTATEDNTNYKEGAQAVLFDNASNQYLSCAEGTCGGITELDFDGETPITYGCWARRTAGPAGWHKVMGKSDESSLNGYELKMEPAGYIMCIIGDDDPDNENLVNSNFTVTLSNWNHLVCQADGRAIYVWGNNSVKSELTEEMPIDTDSSFLANSSNADADWSGDLDECFVDDIFYDTKTKCRVCSCQFDGKLCMCDGIDPTAYKSCSSNSDCRVGGNTVATCESSLCKGRNVASCGTCTLPSCNQQQPSAKTQPPPDWRPYTKATWRFETKPGLLVGEGSATNKTLTNNGTALADTTNYLFDKQAVVFDKASNQYLSCTDATCGGAANLDFDGTKNATWGCAVRPTSWTGDSGTYHPIIDKLEANNGGYSLGMGGADASGWTCKAGRPSTTPKTVYFGDVSVNEWRLPVCTLNGNAIAGDELGGDFVNGSESATTVRLIDAAADIALNSSVSTTDWSGQLDECFVDDIAWGNETKCRVWSCGLDGKGCACKFDDPTQYAACSTNTDCQSNGTPFAICRDSFCQGRDGSGVNWTCSMPPCNQAQPTEQDTPPGAETLGVSPTDWTDSMRLYLRYEDTPGLEKNSGATIITGDLVQGGTVVNSSNQYREGAEAALYSDSYLYCSDENCGGTSKLDLSDNIDATWGCFVRFSAWMTNPGDWFDILAKKNSSDGWGLYVWQSTGYPKTHRPACGIAASSIDVKWQYVADTTALNEWYHFVCSYDTSADEGWLYHNGKLAAYTAQTGGGIGNTGASFRTNDPDNAGADYWDGYQDECFVDDVNWTGFEVCRACSCGIRGERCMCDVGVSAAYKACTYDSDCRVNGNTEALCDEGLCKGLHSTQCRSCGISACNAGAPPGTVAPGTTPEPPPTLP